MLPVSYFSKSLSLSERQYPALKLELMSIVKSINVFKYFLYKGHFTILSNSKPIEYYKRSSSPVDLITRWLVDLDNYDFTFKYLKCESSVLTVFFSRGDFTNHFQDLNTNPKLIHNQNILPLTTKSPIIELHHFLVKINKISNLKSRIWKFLN